MCFVWPGFGGPPVISAPVSSARGRTRVVWSIREHLVCLFVVGVDTAAGVVAQATATTTGHAVAGLLDIPPRSSVPNTHTAKQHPSHPLLTQPRREQTNFRTSFPYPPSTPKSQSDRYRRPVRSLVEE